jgi:hypothetical protein
MFSTFYLFSELRKVVRGSRVSINAAAPHTHTFGAEEYDDEKDMYFQVCSTCDFISFYEKM